MENLKVGSAQFQPANGDKAYNLSIIKKMSGMAAEEGVQAVAFHELSITAYTFLKDLDEKSIQALSEEVPDGPSCQQLCNLSEETGIAVLAGLVEADKGNFYNTYVCASRGRIIATHRKLHPFISKYLSPGEKYTLFDLHGWKCGILTCYDNNIIENVRATTLLGAQVIFAPHVTGLTPSPMPGRGYVEDGLWENRENDPVPLRMEFNGPKGRGWLMRWLPARAFDNGVYYVFSNPVGYDGDQLKNGNAMILDPYGELLDEVCSFDAGLAVANLTADKLQKAGGWRYRQARRPDLYREILGRQHEASTNPVWLKKTKKG